MYLLDANVFISAKNRHYGFAFVPGFWDWLDREHSAGTWCSIDKIYQELRGKQDELSVWATSRKHMFLGMDAASQPSLATISAWTSRSPLYTPGAKNHFLASADYQLVAYAQTHGHTVVTHEVSEPTGKFRVKIPDACAANGVGCMDPFSMLSRAGARFVL